MKELRSRIAVAVAAAPAVGSDTIEGTRIDMQGFASLTILSVIGAGAYAADKYVTPVLTESDDDLAYTAVGEGDRIGNLSKVDAALAADDLRTVAYVGHKRYVKFSYEVTGTLAADVLLGAFAIKGHPQHAPTV